MTKDRPLNRDTRSGGNSRSRLSEKKGAECSLPPTPAERDSYPSPSLDGHSLSSASQSLGSSPSDQDRLTIDEVGANWVRLQWVLTPKTQERAASAMGRDGHRSTRVLRVLRIVQDDSSPRSKELVEEIVLPVTAAAEWFLHLPPTEHAWLVEIGLIFGQNRFFSMIHSAPVVLNGNRVSLPGGETWQSRERFLDMLEGGEPPPLKVQGKFVLSGVTRPGAHATIDDCPVSVNPRTGEFQWELPLSNGRVVIPLNVEECGKVQRALLALDLNFHLLEPEPGPEY